MTPPHVHTGTQLALAAAVIALAAGLTLAGLVAARMRRTLRREAAVLALVGVGALAARLALDSAQTGAERLPYLFQAACIAWEEARAGLDLCLRRPFFGDPHQLGPAVLYAAALRLSGGDPAAPAAVATALSILDTVLVYGIARAATGRRAAGFAAALLHAVEPWTGHFARAPQGEALYDTALLGGLALAVLGRRLPEGDPARRLCESPLVRGLWCGLGASVRSELPLLGALFVADELLRGAGGRARTRRLALLAAGALAGLLPLLPAMAVQLSSVGASPQGGRALFYAQEFALGMMGPVRLAAVVLLAAAAVTRRRERAAALALTGAAVLLQALHLLAIGHKTGNVHVAYHGLVLWWPALGALLAGLAGGVAGRVAPVGGALVLALLAPGVPPPPSPWSSAQADALARAVPPRARVVAVGPGFATAPLAARLFARGEASPVLHEAREADRVPAQACAAIAPLLEAADAHVLVLEDVHGRTLATLRAGMAPCVRGRPVLAENAAGVLYGLVGRSGGP